MGKPKRGERQYFQVMFGLSRLGKDSLCLSNDFYQPLRKGGHILTWFLGDIVKNGDLCPIGQDNWHKVDKVYKADIVALVRQKFVLPVNEVVGKKLLRRVGKAWRNYRYQLKRDHKKPGKTKQEVKDAMPGNLVRDQWIKLVNY